MKVYHQPPYPQARKDQFWEEFKDGQPQSAVYLGGEESFRLLGVTEQLVGAEWTGATGFQYCGSIGPNSVTQGVLEEYRQIGLAMWTEFGVRGLFGVDTVLSPAGELFPIELNPRYTASVEVLERALGMDSIRWHVESCSGGPLPAENWSPEMNGVIHGKAILFARSRYVITDRFVRWYEGENDGSVWPALADLPREGTVIEAGQPVVTVFASGGCVESVRYELQRKAMTIFDILSTQYSVRTTKYR